MKKKQKHSISKADTHEIVKLHDLTEGKASITYDDEEEAEQELKKRKVPKAVYRSVLVLLVVMLGLVVWINRANLAPDNILRWVKLQVMGTGAGDGFPVPIKGANVKLSNFTQYDGMASVLSDTAFTMLNSTGREIVYVRHSFNNPAFCSAYGNYLLYNSGSIGYIVQSGTDTLHSGSAPKDILAGAVARGGRYALGMQGADGASYMEVYLKDGTVQYEYRFAKDYITAMTLNYDATYGAVCTVRSEKGEMISKISVFDFNKEAPIAEYETRGNLLLGAYWGENGNLYVVGDCAVLTANSSSYEFQEYSYSGRQLTEFHLDANRAFVSVSAYEHAGPSTMLVFSGAQDPLKIEAKERIEAISVSGGTVGTLEGENVVLYDYTTGMEQKRASAGSDAQSIALANERMAYVLGISEVRTVEMEN